MTSLLLASLLAGATFASVKEGAVVLERPQQTILALVGACDAEGGALNGECLENTKEVTDRVRGKRVALDLGVGHEALLAFEGRRGDKARFVWAPLYDVRNGLALTVGKPQRVSDNGSVVVRRRPIDGIAPADLSDLDLSRLAKNGALGIEIVGRFGKPWTLKAKGTTVKGVTFEVEALRLYQARTGATAFESTQALR